MVVGKGKCHPSIGVSRNLEVHVSRSGGILRGPLQHDLAVCIRAATGVTEAATGTTVGLEEQIIILASSKRWSNEGEL